VEVCALSSPFRVGRAGTTCFSARIKDGRPRGGARARLFVLPSCQRPAHRNRTPGRAPAHHAMHCSLCGLIAGRRHTEWKACYPFVSCKLFAAARKERFGAKPGRAVMVRRRWHMGSYYHSSTVFQTRRETFRFFLAVKHWPTYRYSWRSCIRNPNIPIAEHAGVISLQYRGDALAPF